MTPDQAFAEARSRGLRPVYLVVGPESYLAAELVRGLVELSGLGATASLNVDKLQAHDVSVGRVLGAVRTVPMMAPRRVVVLAGLEKWEKPDGEALEALARYCLEPVGSSLLVMVASKLNGSRKLVRDAKKGGYLVRCDPLGRQALPSWIVAQADTRGHAMAADVAEALAELVGPELGAVSDAVERLGLYVGAGAPIDENALAAVVTRVRQQDAWAMVDALAERDLGTALAVLGDVAGGRDGGPMLLGAMAWKVRQLVRYRSARRAGSPPAVAAEATGVPAFRAGAMEATARRLSGSALRRWLLLLGEADLGLKGSRRSDHDVLATLLVELCRAK